MGVRWQYGSKIPVTRNPREKVTAQLDPPLKENTDHSRHSRLGTEGFKTQPVQVQCIGSIRHCVPAVK